MAWWTSSRKKPAASPQALVPIGEFNKQPALRQNRAEVHQPGSAAIGAGCRIRNSGGLPGVRLAVSDSHSGLKAAVAQVRGATWQRCQAHFAHSLQAAPRRPTAG